MNKTAGDEPLAHPKHRAKAGEHTLTCFLARRSWRDGKVGNISVGHKSVLVTNPQRQYLVPPRHTGVDGEWMLPKVAVVKALGRRGAFLGVVCQEPVDEIKPRLCASS